MCGNVWERCVGIVRTMCGNVDVGNGNLTSPSQVDDDLELHRVSGQARKYRVPDALVEGNFLCRPSNHHLGGVSCRCHHGTNGQRRSQRFVGWGPPG